MIEGNIQTKVDLPTKEPQLSFMWEVAIEENGRESSSDFLEKIKFHALSVSIPEESVSTIESKFMGKSFFYTGEKEGEKEVSIQFFDDIELNVYRYFSRWLYMGTDPAFERMEAPSVLFKKIKCILKDSTDWYKTGELEFEKAFPKSIGNIDLDYETNDFLKFDVTFQYHYKFINGQKYGY